MTEVEALRTRPARPADFPAVWRLLRRAGIAGDEDHDAVAARFGPLLLHPAVAALVAETPRDGVCGFALVAFHPELVGNGRAWLVHLATAEGPGGGEAAAALVRAATETARSRWRVDRVHAGDGPWPPAVPRWDRGAAVTGGG